jgi:putative nucleotidyltransferase with HDIG domain
MQRAQALEIVEKYVKNPNLINHMLSVEAAMRFYARKFNEDEEKWAVTGLLHDFDWEIHPTLEEHPQAGEPILRELGVPDEIIRAVLSHAEHTGVSDFPIWKRHCMPAMKLPVWLPQLPWCVLRVRCTILLPSR